MRVRVVHCLGFRVQGLGQGLPVTPNNLQLGSNYPLINRYDP